MKQYRATFFLRTVTLVGSVALFASIGFLIVRMFISLQVSLDTIFVAAIAAFIAWSVLVEMDLLAIAIERTLLAVLHRAGVVPPRLLFTEYRPGLLETQPRKTDSSFGS